MQREIKFRAWDKGTGKMIVTGFHVFGEYTLFNGIGEYLMENSLGKGSLERYNDVEIMQFTGTLDKNGKEIYDGDILTGPNGKLWAVEWQRCGWWVNTERVVRTKKWEFARDEQYHILDFLHYLKTELPEVVGNVFEHPELFK